MGAAVSRKLAPEAKKRRGSDEELAPRLGETDEEDFDVSRSSHRQIPEKLVYRDLDRGREPKAHIGDEPPVVERSSLDAELREHLIHHATVHRVENTLAAATKMVMKTQHARRALERRKVSNVALPAVDDREVDFDDSADTHPHHHHHQKKKKKKKKKPKTTPMMTREMRIVEGIKLLQERAAFIHVRSEKMLDDGNCQFRALAHELLGDQCHHLWIRRRVVDRLKRCADEYSIFVGDSNDYREYCRRMAVPRTWGDELTLRAACEEYDCVVHVVTTEREHWLLHYYPEKLNDALTTAAKPPKGTRELFLAYVAPIHYDVIALLPNGGHR